MTAVQQLVRRVLPDLAQAEELDLKAQIEALKLENANLKAKGSGLKITEKGGVSAYGMGRFPVTLYYKQWLKLLDRADEIRAFLESNKDSLSIKED